MVSVVGNHPQFILLTKLTKIRKCPYIFRLTYKQSFTKNGETIEKSSTVKLKKTTSLPFISVYPSKGMFSPGDDVVFSVNVKGGTYSGNVTYKWTCYDKFGECVRTFTNKLLGHSQKL